MPDIRVLIVMLIMAVLVGWLIVHTVRLSARTSRAEGVAVAIGILVATSAFVYSVLSHQR